MVSLAGNHLSLSRHHGSETVILYILLSASRLAIMVGHIILVVGDDATRRRCATVAAVHGVDGDNIVSDRYTCHIVVIVCAAIGIDA